MASALPPVGDCPDLTIPIPEPYEANIPFSLLTDEERRGYTSAVSAGQGGVLFGAWPPGETDAEHKKALLRQLAAFDSQYPGGVVQYHSNAVALLEQAASGVNPLVGQIPEVPVGMNMKRDADEYMDMVALGKEHIHETAFVMVAGGLGERLGYPGIKIALPTNTVTMETMLGHYLGFVKEWQRLGGEGCVIPFTLMTSDDTHDETAALLKEHNYFGLPASQITLLKQGKVPALCNNQADFCTLEENPYRLNTKPHGHGDVHQLIAASGLAEQWVAPPFDKKHIFFIQDTHALVVHKVLATLGVSIAKGYAMNSITVPRKPGEASGSICCLQDNPEHPLRGGNPLTINVEYNQLNPLLQAAFGRSDAAEGPDGFSPYPGNVNAFVIDLPLYSRVLADSRGAVPEFVNPKFNADKTAFTSPTRLECMMQDIPLAFPKGAKVGFTLFERELYCPIKNSVKDGAAKQGKGQQASCAVDSEAAFYENSLNMLKAAGADLVLTEVDGKEEWGGVSVASTPKVIFAPSFALTVEELAGKVGRLRITPNSTLVVKGRNVSIEKLDLDGALFIHVSDDVVLEIDGLVVENTSCRRVATAHDEPSPALAMRGYKTVCDGDAMHLHFTEPGRYILGASHSFEGEG